MRQRNPGSLGLIEGPRVAAKEAKQAEEAPAASAAAVSSLQSRASRKPGGQDDNHRLITRPDEAIVDAINSLEDNGYVAPYVCVFGRKPFQAAFTPINNSTVLPRDRIEPLIGRELLHASGIDIPPHRPGLYENLDREEWQSRGVLLSMANEPIDLALAAEATPEFRQVDLDGKYVFSVFERFALRIKDAQAIVPLMFEGHRGTLPLPTPDRDRGHGATCARRARAVVRDAGCAGARWDDRATPRGLGHGGCSARQSLERGERAVPRRRAGRRDGVGAAGGQRLPEADAVLPGDVPHLLEWRDGRVRAGGVV